MTKSALVVGINAYPINSLANCVHDAEQVAGILSTKEYGFNADIITDERATRREIKNRLQDLFTGESDFIVFYFAGHGITGDFDSYLAPVDSDEVDAGISLSYFKTLARNGKAKNKTILIILDCCHSGSASIRSINHHNFRTLTNYDVERSIGQMGEGKALMAACLPTEYAYEEPSLNHGIFTYYLLEGLYGDAADTDGKITLGNLYDYISRRFEPATKQTPVFKGDLYGRISIGAGLTPSSLREPPSEVSSKIVSQAKELVNHYLELASVNLDKWKRESYKEACQALEPCLRWFESRLEQYPRLKEKKEFQSAYSAARSKLSELANIDVDFTTPLGTVTSRIGSGTFGTVWKIKEDDDREIAYKVYHPIDLHNVEKLGRFDRGYRAMKQLDHPNIVQVREFTKCPIGFTMDFIPGSNLRDFVGFEISPHHTSLILLTIAETLHHAHERGVIHRDVKPENIIIQFNEDSYQPFLTDFDLAWFSTATQFTREGLGSLIYAAPEQLNKPNSRSAHSPTTDIFSFGQLIFFVICQRDPIPLTDNLSVLNNNLRTWTWESPASKLSDLYSKCTSSEPADRISNFRDICDIVFDISQDLDPASEREFTRFNEFSKQLLFSVVGLSNRASDSDTSFLSNSGQTRVTLYPDEEIGKRISFTARFELQQAPVIGGANSSRAARDIINQRIDSSLSAYSEVSKRPGTQGLYEVEVAFSKITMNADGIDLCRQIITRVIDSIERQ